jgi:hypothetical protein
MMDFLQKLNELKSLLEKDVDYLYIGNFSKPILSKGGAELVAKFFNLRMHFIPVYFDNVNAVFECKLFNEKDKEVVNGYGSADLSKFKNKDHNHVIKMAKKRALVDAVLSYSCLSRYFTQDLEDEVFDVVDSGSSIKVDDGGSLEKQAMLVRINNVNHLAELRNMYNKYKSIIEKHQLVGEVTKKKDQLYHKAIEDIKRLKNSGVSVNDIKEKYKFIFENPYQNFKQLAEDILNS